MGKRSEQTSLQRIEKDSKYACGRYSISHIIREMQTKVTARDNHAPAEGPDPDLRQHQVLARMWGTRNAPTLPGRWAGSFSQN